MRATATSGDSQSELIGSECEGEPVHNGERGIRREDYEDVSAWRARRAKIFAEKVFPCPKP